VAVNPSLAESSLCRVDDRQRRWWRGRRLPVGGRRPRHRRHDRTQDNLDRGGW